ncbi:MAG: cell division protein ZapA [Treponema sp.]|nr:cell division protein ZapA [Treponema sp.]
MGQIQVNILGTSFKLQADEDTQFLTKLLDYYEKIVNKVSLVDSAKNNLQISIVSGLLLCEELFKEKANKLKNLSEEELNTYSYNTELEKRTSALIEKINKVL